TASPTSATGSRASWGTSMNDDVRVAIERGWDERDQIGTTTSGDIRSAVDQAVAALDSGSARVAEPGESGEWSVNQWLKKAVLLPSFVNIGARVGEGAMIDTWATVGSCAQIGRNVHISGGAGIGGVLEPLQAGPVIIEDDCFIGARSEVAEGVVVERGSVLSMGVFLGASTKIVDRASGEVRYGRVPAYSVVVPRSEEHTSE